MKESPVPDDVRVLTHHVNVRNPNTKKVHTFGPGDELPPWAADTLAAEDHVAYQPVKES